jgi:WD40 repeat protein
VKLWDAATGAPLRTFGAASLQPGEVHCARFSHDGARLALGASDGHIAVRFP